MRIFSKEKWKEDVATWDLPIKTRMYLIRIADESSEFWVSKFDGKSEDWFKENGLKIDDSWMVEKEDI